MPDFNDIRIRLQNARKEAAENENELLQAKEALKKLNAADSALDRVFDGQNERHRAERNRIARDKEKYAGELQRLKETKNQLGLTVNGHFSEFLFAQPQEQVEQLSDDTPFLLFPVRLETRFKTVTSRAGGTQEQLWVRVFPDDCMVDSFEAELSESEVKSAVEFWSGMWKAGGVKLQERGAWRSLVASQGSGRAAWILKNADVMPQNAADKPKKVKETDVILVIPSDEDLTVAQRSTLETYWKTAWLSDGLKSATETAFNTFVSTLDISTEEASGLLKKYAPLNFLEKPVFPFKKNEVTLSVAFPVFKKPETLTTKQTSWTRAPKVNILPDRFVLILDDGSPDGPKEHVGRAIPSPLTVGVDPSAEEADQLKQEDGDMKVGEEMRWMVDFERAVEWGMGFKIDLTPLQARAGFKRLTVLGLRLSTDAGEGKTLVEDLFSHHQFGKSGFSLLPQGTPTNNVEDKSAGHSRSADADADASFDIYLADQDQFELSNDWSLKRDGQWLAEWLGISPAQFQRTLHAGGKDQCHAKAMNTALWPATLGYLMDTMMQQVFDSDRDNRGFDDEAVVFTRWFFTNFVSGRGAAPAIRIGRQPYGILPVTDFSKMQGFQTGRFAAPQGISLPENWREGMTELYRILSLMRTDWLFMSRRADFVGKAGDPHKTLMSVVGLHASSVEYYQRYMLGIEHLWNLQAINSVKPNFATFQEAKKKMVASGDDVGNAQGLDDNGMFFLHNKGYTGEAVPDILNKFFVPRQSLMKGPVVDDVPLSETDPIRVYTPSPDPTQPELPGMNYIEWLIKAAGTSHETLRKEEGFLENKSPVALLYLLMRHALMEGYADAGWRIYFEAQLMNVAEVRAAKLEKPFIHIQENNKASESRWGHLYRAEPQVTGSDSMLMVDHVTSQVKLRALTARYVTEQIAALEHLKNASTAQLERVFAEHLDTVSYRLDAWLWGMKHFHLASMRFRQRDNEGPAGVRQGVYVGAYGWLEEVKPEFKNLQPQQLNGDLAEIFNKPEEPTLVKDSTNYGYIHAPSLNHAVTAAVLRNANKSYATDEEAETFAVNLSSERVRRALALLEGIRNGQSLAALLGYELERGLHDRYNESEMLFLDGLIFDLRMAFPLVVNRLANTRDQDGSIQSIEARNVVNGLSLIDHVKTSGNRNYPFGRTDLPAAESQAQANAVSDEVERLLDIHDALADLAMAEGVHQVGLGNYDRAAATLDAFGKATFPVEPEVVQTPRSGVTLTHRVGIHLETGLISAPTDNPRVRTEPALNKWLKSILPLPENTGAWVTYFDAVSNSNKDIFITQALLQLQPLDLLHLLDMENEQAMTELDDRLEHYVRSQLDARPEADVTIGYTKPNIGKITFFELSPLLKSLRALMLSSRPLRPGDIALHEEASKDADKQVFFENSRGTALTGVIIDLNALSGLLSNPASAYAAMKQRYLDMADLETHIATPEAGDDVEALKAALVIKKQEIFDALDVLATTAAGHFHDISLFGIRAAGTGPVYDTRRSALTNIVKQVTELLDRWNQKSIDFTTLLNTYDTLPLTATDAERFELLAQLERLVTTTATVPLPDDLPAPVRLALDGKKTAFDNKQQAFENFLAALPDTMTGVRNGILQIVTPPANPPLPLSAFDLNGIDMKKVEQEMLTFGADLLARADNLVKILQKQTTVANAKITEYNTAADSATGVEALTQAAQAIFGEGYRMIPAFSVTPQQADEWANAVSVSGDLTKFQSEQLTGDQQIDFPVDHWLYGVARVREKMGHWEKALLLSEAFGSRMPDLEPAQLPFWMDDRWMALQFRKPTETEADFKVDADRLLYTAAYAAPFDKNAFQCGLLIDEWTEVIPTRKETTGITFHYDRPNAEPPQAILLAMPSVFRGHWEWQDLVNSLNETWQMAQMRAVEPGFVDDTTYARFLPAAVMTVSTYLLTISTNLAVNNQMYAFIKET